VPIRKSECIDESQLEKLSMSDEDGERVWNRTSGPGLLDWPKAWSSIDEVSGLEVHPLRPMCIAKLQFAAFRCLDWCRKYPGFFNSSTELRIKVPFQDSVGAIPIKGLLLPHQVWPEHLCNLDRVFAAFLGHVPIHMLDN
jgi:hypothetical protein